MIPPLDENGLLPPGVHDCALEEIEQRFARFGRTGHRRRLFEKLERFAVEARQSGLVHSVIVDGSFVTAKQEPGDIDLALGLSPEVDLTITLRPFEYNVVSKRMVKRLYDFDLLGVAPDGSEALAEYVDVFHRVRGKPGATKGVLRVRL